MNPIDGYREACRASLAWAQRSDYMGHDKHDGLNSPLLWRLCKSHRWTRLLAIQAVMRSPVDPRRLLAVPRNRNPKGLALFAGSLIDLYAADQRREDLEEGRRLLRLLLGNPARGFTGLGWGYAYPWQDVGFYAPKDSPTRVVTCWVGLAMLDALRVCGDPEFRAALPRIARFLLEEPAVLHRDAEMLCYSYVPDPSVRWAVMDVPALMGAFLAEAGHMLGEPAYEADARRLIRWVVDKQTEYGAWFYTHPRGESLIRHDNYHTAIILDSLDRYREATGDEQFDEAYWRGLDYYGAHLFTERGAPRWMNDRRYPHDIHGAASGALCFVRAAYRRPGHWQMATRILDWALETLYDPRGFFYYQRGRLFTKRVLFLRWNNGWMCRALAAAIRFSESR